MNVLFLVTESKSANGICCESVMKKLILKGHNVFCVTNKEVSGNPQIDGVNYSFVKPRFVYYLFAKAAACSGIKKALLNIIAAVFNKIKLLLTVNTWPLISKSYCNRVLKASKSICDNYKIDIIIPVYTQIDTLIAADKIKSIHNDIKLVPYFLDSFSGGYGPKIFSKNQIINRGIKWEDKLLPSADRIIMMLSCRSHYYKHSSTKPYFKNIVFLDLPLLNIQNSNVLINNDTKRGLKKLLYIGTIPLHIRNPKYFLELFKNIDDKNIRLDIVGSCTDMGLLKKWTNSDDRISIHSFVEHSKAEEMIKDADILINFGNNNSHMTPCKVFEYMSYGKPIISTAPILDEPSSVYLKRYPNALIINEYKHNFNEDVALLKGFILGNHTIGEAEIEIMNKEFYFNTPDAFVSELERM